MNEIEFRLFLEKDFPALEEMIFLLYSEDSEGEEINSLKIKNTAHEFNKFPEKGEIYIFTMDGVTIGYAITVCFWSNEFGGDVQYIDEIYVKREYRNKRIGSRFFNHLSQTKISKIKGLAVEVTPKNTKAIKLYEKLGFKNSANKRLFKRTD